MQLLLKNLKLEKKNRDSNELYFLYFYNGQQNVIFKKKEKKVLFKINSTAERNRFRLNGDYKSKQTLFDNLYQCII